MIGSRPPATEALRRGGRRLPTIIDVGSWCPSLKMKKIQRLRSEKSDERPQSLQVQTAPKGSVSQTYRHLCRHCGFSHHPQNGGESRRQTALLSRDNRAKVHRRYFCRKVTKLMSYDTIKIFKKDLYEGSHSCGFSALAKNELSLATLIGSPFG